MSNSHPIKVIAVTGGKGGVGKSSITLNLAVAIADKNRKVLLLDADLGLANIDVMLGLKAPRNLTHVLEGQCRLEDILLEGPSGLKIVPASSGTQKMSQLSLAENAGIIQSFSELSDNVDYLFIDTAAGISDNVLSFLQASQDIVLVVCDEPTSIADSYALMKILSQKFNRKRFRVIANMAHSPADGKRVFSKITKVADKFLDVSLDFVGMIPFDDNIRKAIKKQKPLVHLTPRSPASVAIKNISNKVINWRVPNVPQGNIEFFMERLLNNKKMTVENI
ncbi:MAG: MinD/ParA family protein [Pseudomonadota bacterium]